jgi:hypothetical protein
MYFITEICSFLPLLEFYLRLQLIYAVLCALSVKHTSTTLLAPIPYPTVQTVRSRVVMIKPLYNVGYGDIHSLNVQVHVLIYVIIYANIGN